MKNLLPALLALLIFLGSLTGCAGCSKPPELTEELRATLTGLIESSFEINDILFGDGLVTTFDQSGLPADYTDEIKRYENYYSDEETAEILYSPVVSTYRDENGKAVSQYVSVEQIREAAAKVYTGDYLDKIMRATFEGDVVLIGGKSYKVRARYREDKDEEEGTCVLTKYKYIDGAGMNFIKDRGGQTKYDYSTMKIVAPSSATTLIVEIQGYYQDFTLDSSSPDVDDWKSVPGGYSWHTVKLCFTYSGGEWRLEAPTY